MQSIVQNINNLNSIFFNRKHNIEFSMIILKTKLLKSREAMKEFKYNIKILLRKKELILLYYWCFVNQCDSCNFGN